MHIPEHILREAIREELEAKRAAKRARADLLEWCKQSPPTKRGPMDPYGWQRHTAAIMQDCIMRMVHQQGPRDIEIHMFDAPQQSGKSQIAKEGGSFAMGHGLSIGVLAYNAPFARRWGRDMRRLLRHDNAMRVWPHFNRDKDDQRKRRAGGSSDAATEWTVPHPDKHRPPVLFAASGRKGGLEGLPLDLVIIDDLYKTISDAQSDANVRTVTDLLETSVLGRITEMGGVVWDIGTRRGARDTKAYWLNMRTELEAAGLPVRIYRHSYPLRGSEPWRYGDRGYLTPNWNEDKEKGARIRLGRFAACLLDQEDIDDVGGLINPNALSHRYDEHPEIARRNASEVWLSLDGAETEDGGDWSSLGTLARRDGFLDVVKLHRFQRGPLDVVDEVIREVKRTKATKVLIEYTSSGKMATMILKNHPVLSRLVHVEEIRPAGHKRDRLQSAFGGPGMAGTLRYPKPGPDTEWCYGIDDDGLDHHSRLLRLRGDRPDMRGEVDDEADMLGQALQHHTELLGEDDAGDFWDALSALGV